MIRVPAALEVARSILEPLEPEVSDEMIQLAATLIRIAVCRDEDAQKAEREERTLSVVPVTTGQPQ